MTKKDTMKTCLKCNTICKVTKKGFDSKKNQRWLCHGCKKSFVEIKEDIKELVIDLEEVLGDIIEEETDHKKELIKEQIKKPEKTCRTSIFVNNNEIKVIEKEISSDQAFDLISEYFKEVTKTEVTSEKDKDGNKVIKFKIKAGTKGNNI